MTGILLQIKLKKVLISINFDSQMNTQAELCAFPNARTGFGAQC